VEGLFEEGKKRECDATLLSRIQAAKVKAGLEECNHLCVLDKQ
jgi:hypothetical protein